MRILPSNFLRLPLNGLRYKSNCVIYDKNLIFRRPTFERKIIKVRKTRPAPVTNAEEHISQRLQPKIKVEKNASETVNRSPDYRENEMKIQMLSKHLHEQVFGNSKLNTIDNDQIKRFDFLLGVRRKSII